MPVQLKVEGNGRDVWFFDRHLTGQGYDQAKISTACSPEIINRTDVDAAMAWICRALADCNGNAGEHCVWVNPRVGAALIYFRVISAQQAQAASEAGSRQLRDLVTADQCFVIPEVSFIVGGQPILLSVVVSPRHGDSQLSLVKGVIPPTGVIDMSGRSKTNLLNVTI
ncbi:MAG: hypothetical protein WC675_02850 [Patescibacteria group bacterium]|jgi:hypothetical protein